MKKRLRDNLAKSKMRPTSARTWQPLKIPLFRRVWIASLIMNFGLFVQGVAAAWTMAQLSPGANMVALVQTALMLPIMLLAIPAGAIADMYDQRKIGLCVLSISVVGATVLTFLSFAQALTPSILLILCFVVASGMALFGPAWQAGAAEQVPPEILPQAVAMNSISYSIARSFGPAIGGVIVASAGSVIAFGVNAVLYLPLIAVLYAWRRKITPPIFPPERIDRAIFVGFRYVIHSPPLRKILWRTFAFGAAGGSISALIPLIARDLLSGDSQVYGLILGAFGIGSVIGALVLARLRVIFDDEDIIQVGAPALGVFIAIVALSRSLLVTSTALVAAGMLWMVVITIFNVKIQMFGPRWIAGRMIAAFQAAIAGGIAIGSSVWGYLAQHEGVANALLISGTAMVTTVVLKYWLPLPTTNEQGRETVDLSDPDIKLEVESRAGPIIIEIVYNIAPLDAERFYKTILHVKSARKRNGASDWSISRDLTNPRIWTERFQLPTWLDYLRQRNRHTEAEHEIYKEAIAFHSGDEPVHVRRMLMHPIDSIDRTADLVEQEPPPLPQNAQP